MSTADVRRAAAERMPILPDGYEVERLKNGNWRGRSPHNDVTVWSPDIEDVMTILRLNAVTHENQVQP